VTEALPLAIRGTGLVTSVGLSAPSACVAIRAKLTNPSQTRFIGPAGEWIKAHQVPLSRPWRGLERLAHMAGMAIEECLAKVPVVEWPQIPLLLCVAEQDRPGRLEGLDSQLFAKVEELLDVRFHAFSGIAPHGRAAVADALKQARDLIRHSGVSRVLVAATDSLLSWPTLEHYQRNDRLLSKSNSNGFMPGEGAGALLVSDPTGSAELVCSGLGFALEPAHIDSFEPLRGDGLTSAIKSALAEADRQMHDMEYCIVDVSGEQYYFNEAALALTRILRKRKQKFDIWHPAECTGEAGALAGVAVLATADAACRKGYSPGPELLAHWSNDNGRRAAAVLRYVSA
jgi:3-oxoacyl-[acyl-carrier-protein] synthase I